MASWTVFVYGILIVFESIFKFHNWINIFSIKLIGQSFIAITEDKF